jgi:hypothetical protein
MNAKSAQYLLGAFYLLIGVLIIILAFTLPSMTLQDGLVFMVIAIFIVLASIMQLSSVRLMCT